MTDPLTIGGVTVKPGQNTYIEIPVAVLPTQTPLHLPVTVFHGKTPGPCVWLSAALHGDELNGVEIIRQVIEQMDVKRLHGTLIAAPIVNVFGFLQQSRYLPDRRDLNRSFPGSKRGPLASVLANLFLEEIVRHCTHGIDLHTGSLHRINLPQVRGNLENTETLECAEAFGAPVIMHAATRDGSLREAAQKRDIPVLLYEAGEPMRFNDEAISTGVRGILRVMARLGMRRGQAKRPKHTPTVVRKSQWVRVRHGGVARMAVTLGQRVRKGQRLAIVGDAFGHSSADVPAPVAGLVIGHTLNPLVNRGDAIVHIGEIHQE